MMCSVAVLRWHCQARILKESAAPPVLRPTHQTSSLEGRKPLSLCCHANHLTGLGLPVCFITQSCLQWQSRVMM